MRDHGYDNELAYMKVFLDTFGMDRPKNSELKKLGAKLNFYKGLPEMFEEFRNGLLSAEHEAHGVTVEHYIISSGLKTERISASKKLIAAATCSMRLAKDARNMATRNRPSNSSKGPAARMI